MLYSFYHWTNWMSYDGNMYRVYRSHWLRHGQEASERCCMDLYKMFNKSGVRRYLMIIIPLIFHFFFLCFFKQKTRTHKKYADKRKTAETWNQKLYCFPSYASPANHNSVFLSLSLSLSLSYLLPCCLPWSTSWILQMSRFLCDDENLVMLRISFTTLVGSIAYVLYSILIRLYACLPFFAACIHTGKLSKLFCSLSQVENPRTSIEQEKHKRPYKMWMIRPLHSIFHVFFLAPKSLCWQTDLK